MTDRLSIYNGSLFVLKQRPLRATATVAALDSDLSYRHDLDEVWENGGRETCLAEAIWNHAIRTQAIEYEPSITDEVGHQYAFTKPDDFVRLAAFSSDGMFTEPYLRYRDEGGYWWSDLQTIYVSFVSKHADYGLDMSIWPEKFTRYVEHYFAFRIVGRVTGADPERVEGAMKRSLNEARGVDAANEATVFPPRGTWVRARNRGMRNRIEQGR